MLFRIEEEKLKIIDATRTEYFQLQLFLTRHVEGYQYQKPFKLGVWDGTVSFFNKEKGIAFGLWYDIKKYCQNNQYDFKLENPDDFPINKDITLDEIQEFANTFFKDHKHPDDKNLPMVPYDYQIKSVHQILKYQFCNIEVGTGGGKSFIYGIFLFYYLTYVNPKAKVLLIVPRISLVKQFYNDLNFYNLGFYKENKTPLNLRMHEVMSSKPRECKNPNIIIGTYQSLEKEPKAFFEQFDVVTVDEAHQAKAKTLTTILNKTITHAKIRFGMSGTYPESTTADYLNILSLTGPIVNKVETHQLITMGTVTPVKIKAVILNHQDSEFRTNLFWIKRAGRGQEAFNLEREYIHNSKKRLDFMLDKILAKVTKNTLVLFFTIDYGNKIYDECRNRLMGKDIYYVDGGTDGEKREHIKRTMESTEGNPKILIASYGTFSTGISIKSLSNVILADSFKSEQLIIQSIGRILRLHAEKETANVFDIVDVFDNNLKHQPNILYKHYDARKKFYDKRQYPNDSVMINL